MRKKGRRALDIFCTLMVLSMAVLSVSAQGESEGSRRESDREIEERAIRRRLLESTAPKNKRATSPRLSLEQLQETFTRMQVANNELAEAVARPGVLDHKLITPSVREIGECAIKLRDNFGLPVSEKEQKSGKTEKTETTIDLGQVKTTLTTLDDLVSEVAHNAIFREASPKDKQLAAKARDDLEKIISLTNAILKTTSDAAK